MAWGLSVYLKRWATLIGLKTKTNSMHQWVLLFSVDKHRALMPRFNYKYSRLVWDFQISQNNLYGVFLYLTWSFLFYVTLFMKGVGQKSSFDFYSIHPNFMIRHCHWLKLIESVENFQLNRSSSAWKLSLDNFHFKKGVFNFLVPIDRLARVK